MNDNFSHIAEDLTRVRLPLHINQHNLLLSQQWTIDYNSALATRSSESHTGLSTVFRLRVLTSLTPLVSLNMSRTFLLVLGFFTSFRGTLGIGQMTCVSFQSSANSFSIVNDRKAAPILISANEWPGVQLAAADFAADILRVTGVETSVTNVSSPLNSSFSLNSLPIIVGTLGKSSLIQQIINSTGLDVSVIQGSWESFMSRVVYNPLPGIDSAYVIIGADKRGTIFSLYDHSEQFGE